MTDDRPLPARKSLVQKPRPSSVRMRFLLILFLLGLGLPEGLTQNEDVGPKKRWESGRLVGTGSEPLPYRGVEAFPGLPLKKAVDLDRFAPSGAEPHWIVTELGGKIGSFPESGPFTEREPVFAFEPPESSPSPGQRPGSIRIYSIEFHPRYPSTPWVFVSINERVAEQGTNRVARFTVPPISPPRFAPESRVDLLSWTSLGHDGCDLKFGPDGLLYISTGDGEKPGDPANVGQKTNNLLGSILRIDVDATDEVRALPYRIPESNPFTDYESVPPEVWAYGLRNPWRMNFHPETGELFLGDNGDEHWELVRRISAGSNHGWSAYEGSYPFRLSNPLAGPNPTLTTPVWEHPHTEMRSVIGGYFYRGKAHPDLRGQYLYGCYFNRKLWAFSWDPVSRQASDVRRIADLDHQIVSFAEDAEGELLIVTHDGPVYRLEKAPPETPLPIPPLLSETGLYSDTSTLTPSEGVASYEINAEAWEDGAEVVRHFGIPPGPGIQARRGENVQKSWLFPNGSAFARTLTHRSPEGTPFRVETQVMHRDREEWRFLTYRWRPDQSDAELVPEGGDTEPFSVGDLTLSHRFASRRECTACHTQKSFFLLGFSTGQMNHEDQLDRIAKAGWFQPKQEPRPEIAPALASPLDESASLSDRARSYLHVNCAHCHREAGLGGRAEFELLHWLPLEETRSIDTRPLIGLPGLGDVVRVIAPGVPDHSEIVRRMAIRGPNQMPLIGSHKVDQEGLALIREWISSLPDEPSTPENSSPPPP